MPDDYPKSPPKATFKTRIYHPNVEESTGAVCLDTLKKDWQSKLTLRDILIVNLVFLALNLDLMADVILHRPFPVSLYTLILTQPSTLPRDHCCKQIMMLLQSKHDL